MTDTLHDTLWRAMQAHGVGWIDNGTPDARCYCGHRPDRLGASWHAHVADAVIREIPQLRPGVHLTHDGYVMHEEDDDGGHTCYTAGEARDLAAALLAAADYAEKESKETQ